MRVLRITGAAVLCIMVIFASFSFAQEFSEYRVFGTVKDGQGKPLSGVTITLKDVETGRQVQIKSKEDGTFDQQFIKHAMYTVTIEKAGYAPEKIDKLDLTYLPQGNQQTIQRKIDIVLRTEKEKADVLALQKKEQEEIEQAKRMGEDYENARKLLEQKQYDKSIELMAQVSKRAPEAHGPYLAMAAAYAAKGDIDNAITNFEKALSIKPDVADAYVYLGSAYIEKKQYDKATDAYQKYVELKPTDVDARCTLGNLYLALGKDADAEAEIAKGLQSDPNIARCHRVNADILFKKSDMKGGIASLKKYLELDPNAPDKKDVQEMIAALEQMN